MHNVLMLERIFFKTYKNQRNQTPFEKTTFVTYCKWYVTLRERSENITETNTEYEKLYQKIFFLNSLVY